MNDITNDISIVVSVIIPTYNSAQWIKKAIDSVLKQKVSCEIIVIDDFSSDDTRLVISEYLKSERIKYIRNEINLGVAVSRNKGVEVAKGEYVAFLDADDWWAADKLEKQLKFMKDNLLDFSYTGRKLVTHDGIETSRVFHVRNMISYKQLLFHNSIACSSTVIRRELAVQVPMEHSEVHEDYLTWLKMLKRCSIAGGIDEPLLYYRLSNQGKSRDKLKSASMTFGVYRILGFGRINSSILLASHLLHGILKYC
ncbi:MAG: glycosyltransferase family 2 protein [Clostridiales bacterium]|nr:glycosyltransferase family 2 protein [Clostridiales bacterium]